MIFLFYQAQGNGFELETNTTYTQEHTLHFVTIETIMSTVLTHAGAKLCGIHNGVPK